MVRSGPSLGAFSSSWNLTIASTASSDAHAGLYGFRGDGAPKTRNPMISSKRCPGSDRSTILADPDEPHTDMQVGTPSGI